MYLRLRSLGPNRSPSSSTADTHVSPLILSRISSSSSSIPSSSSSSLPTRTIPIHSHALTSVSLSHVPYTYLGSPQFSSFSKRSYSTKNGSPTKGKYSKILEQVNEVAKIPKGTPSSGDSKDQSKSPSSNTKSSPTSSAQTNPSPFLQRLQSFQKEQNHQQQGPFASTSSAKSPVPSDLSVDTDPDINIDQIQDLLKDPSLLKQTIGKFQDEFRLLPKDAKKELQDKWKRDKTDILHRAKLQFPNDMGMDLTQDAGNNIPDNVAEALESLKDGTFMSDFSEAEKLMMDQLDPDMRRTVEEELAKEFPTSGKMPNPAASSNSSTRNPNSSSSSNSSNRNPTNTSNNNSNSNNRNSNSTIPPGQRGASPLTPEQQLERKRAYEEYFQSKNRTQSTKPLGSSPTSPPPRNTPGPSQRTDNRTTNPQSIPRDQSKSSSPETQMLLNQIQQLQQQVNQLASKVKSDDTATATTNKSRLPPKR